MEGGGVLCKVFGEDEDVGKGGGGGVCGGEMGGEGDVEEIGEGGGVWGGGGEGCDVEVGV